MLEHRESFGLFPCGEGGDYARGIMPATMDGGHCAEADVVNN